jgi:hypothetical protein
MLSVIILSVFMYWFCSKCIYGDLMMRVFTLSIANAQCCYVKNHYPRCCYAEYCYNERRYAECRYIDSRGAVNPP